MDTQLDALPILPVLAWGVSGCVNSAFSQQISTFYEPSVQVMDTQLGARHRWRTPTIHRGSAERRIGVRPTGGLQVTRQRSETGRPAVADDERVWRATARGYYGPSSPAAAETHRAVHCFKMPSLAKSPPTCDAFRRSASAMLVTPMVRSKPIVAFRKAAITSGPERLRIRLASSPIVTSRT